MKINIKDSQFKTYRSCLINAITADKIESKRFEKKIKMLSDLEQIDNTVDLRAFIEIHLDEISYKKLRNATYQRKFSEENDLAIIKIKRDVFDGLQEISELLGDVGHEKVINHLMKLYWRYSSVDDAMGNFEDDDLDDESYDEVDDDQEQEDEDFETSHSDEHCHDLSISFPLGHSGTMMHQQFLGGIPIHTELSGGRSYRGKPNQGYVKKSYDGEVITKAEAQKTYANTLKKHRLKKQSPEITDVIDGLFPEDITSDNIVEVMEACHKVRKSLIEKGFMSSEIKKDEVVISKSFSYADYEEDAYAYFLVDIMNKCFGVDYDLVTKGKKDDAMVFKGMPANVQAAYDIYNRLYQFFKRFAQEKMDSYHKNTKLKTRRRKMGWATIDIINSMFDQFNLEAGEYSEYDFLDVENRKLVQCRKVYAFSDYYDFIY
ncbi:MAG: hypothetical protein O2809_06195 [Proteobacteria bacterium]|nr:hypothetical protein [Pseudomonadota bacterium]